MAFKRYRRYFLLLALPVLLLVLLGASGVVTIQVTINGEKIPGAWRLERGRVTGPVASVAHELGAQVRLRGETLEIIQPSPWEDFDMEPAWAIVWPHSTVALAPVITLRRFLAEKQFESLQVQNPTAPVLARFEIVSGYSRGWGVPPGSPLDPYILQVYQYWVTPQADTPSRVNPGIQTITPGSGWGLIGPKYASVRIDKMEYQVKPSASVESTYQGKSFQESTGWGEVKELSVLDSTTVDLKGSGFPAYDLSVTRIPEKWRWQGL